MKYVSLSEHWEGLRSGVQRLRAAVWRMQSGCSWVVGVRLAGLIMLGFSLALALPAIFPFQPCSPSLLPFYMRQRYFHNPLPVVEEEVCSEAVSFWGVCGYDSMGLKPQWTQ